MKTITWMHADYYVVPALVAENCSGCHFETAQCNDVRHYHECFEEHEDGGETDLIFIPATDEALAQWTVWRMNGYVEEDEE